MKLKEHNERMSPDDPSTQVYQIDGVITDAEKGEVEFAPPLWSKQTKSDTFITTFK
jgi:hypothetical protein